MLTSEYSREPSRPGLPRSPGIAVSTRPAGLAILKAKVASLSIDLKEKKLELQALPGLVEKAARFRED